MRFRCDINHDDEIYAETRYGDKKHVRVTVRGLLHIRSVALDAKRAREFAAEILRIADEIDPPKEKPMSTKKPIEFESRMVASLNVSVKPSGLLSIGPHGFSVTSLPELRKALDEYEAAVKKANTLTLGDLEVDEWFRMDLGATVNPAPLRVIDRFKTGMIDYCTTTGARFTGRPDTPVRRLKATFEVVE